jgi:hypothetical protein
VLERPVSDPADVCEAAARPDLLRPDRGRAQRRRDQPPLLDLMGLTFPQYLVMLAL